ncbi:hypothetical protein GLV99_01165 [Virgibacillus massiliensis]|nr:hypothetical protein [Virgibacillus massiliensis]
MISTNSIIDHLKYYSFMKTLHYDAAECSMIAFIFRGNFYIFFRYHKDMDHFVQYLAVSQTVFLFSFSPLDYQRQLVYSSQLPDVVGCHEFQLS